MARIKAVDGATLRVNGVAYPIPRGTTINISVGNDQNLTVTGTEQNGDGTNTTLFGVISGMMGGVVVSITDDALEDSFNELFASDEHQVVLTNGGTSYSVASAALVSPNEDGVPKVESNTRKTEAFVIRSLSGKIRRS